MTKERKKELRELLIFMDLKIREAQGTLSTDGILALATYFNDDWEDDKKRHEVICSFLEELK